VTLKGLGVRPLRRERRGDVRVQIDVEVPTKLDDAQRDLLQQFASVRGEEKPAAVGRRGREGFLDRMRDAFRDR
jgi:molecular chaperone DnaJ